MLSVFEIWVCSQRNERDGSKKQSQHQPLLSYSPSIWRFLLPKPSRQKPWQLFRSNRKICITSHLLPPRGSHDPQKSHQGGEAAAPRVGGAADRCWMGLSELTAFTVETWGCSRRNARDVVAAAHKVWLDACYGSEEIDQRDFCLLYTSPSPRDGLLSRMPSSA